MRVVHLSTADVSGGAARAAYRLHEGLTRAGVESSMLVRYRRSRDPRVQECASSTRSEAWHERLRRGGIQREEQRIARLRSPQADYFSLDRARLGRIVLNRIGRPDVIHLHFVAGLVDVPLVLAELTRIAPTVWTLHDMNPFTGGCHYAGDCARYNAGCGRCPQLNSTDESDPSRVIWRRKREAYGAIDSKRLWIVPLSRWIEQTVAGSALLGRFRRRRIPNGIDTTVFAPIERQAARATLGLPVDARIVLFVAASVETRRKGFSLLMSAAANLRDCQDVLLVSVGGQAPSFSQGDRFMHFGEVNDDRLLAALYSASDLFLIPSLEDNLPNTVIEAMACGTPVVGFNVGGIPDMVRSGETGLMVNTGDAGALGAAVRRLLSEPQALAVMGRQSRAVAVEEFSLERQARRFVELYRELAADQAD